MTSSFAGCEPEAERRSNFTDQVGLERKSLISVGEVRARLGTGVVVRVRW